MFEGLLQPTHLIIILIIVLIIFGPGKLPGVGKAIGETMREFKRASSGPDEEKKQPNQPAEKEEIPEKKAE